MVSGKFRSRTYAKKPKTKPSGERTVHRELRKPSKATCGGCGKKLHGVARERPHKMQKLAKTARVPSRPYAGSLCSACMRKELVKRARHSITGGDA